MAPIKFVPLSEHRIDGVPLLPQNLLKAAMNTSDVRSDHSSKCTAFVTKHTKTAAYTFTLVGFRGFPWRTKNDPAKSMPVV